MTVPSLLRDAIHRRATDLLLVANAPPTCRIMGKLSPLQEWSLTADQIECLIKDLCREYALSVSPCREIDGGIVIDGVCRCRVHAYRQQQVWSLALRLIPSAIPSLEDVGLGPIGRRVCGSQSGLVLITGPAGSGKTTTLAAIIGWINESMSRHIITLEDPIEYVHLHRRSVIDQREVGRDTPSFAKGIRSLLRASPDVIVIGELRDRHTMAAALTAAETGHLVMATLHTKGAISTIERIIDLFPVEQQSQIRLQLSSVLNAVLSQLLLPAVSADRQIPLREIFVQTSATRNLIRSNKLHQLRTVMETSRGNGMQTFEAHSQELYMNGAIDDEAWKHFQAASHLDIQQR